MGKTFNNYLGNCVDWNNNEIDALSDMIDSGIEITYRTFINNVPIASVIELFPDYCWQSGHSKELRLKDDWSVRYYRSKYNGKRVYYIVHSAIEYIFGQN